jgi:phosphoglycolate phosphatase-like HAD superfamily hydrolase
MNIALDLDGTLVTCEQRQSAALHAALKSFNQSADIHEIWNLKRSGWTTVEALAKVTGDSEKSNQIALHWQQIIEEPFWLSLDSLQPGVNDTIEEMIQSGSDLFLLTARTRPEWVSPQLEQLGLKKFFKNVEIVSPRGAASNKSIMLNRLRIDAFFGDTESDYAASISASVPFFAVATGQRNMQFLQSAKIPYIFGTLSEAWTKSIRSTY